MKTKHPIHLTDEQRAEVEQLTRTGKAAARVQNRSRILLMADRGCSDAEIVDALSIGQATVERIRRLCNTEGLHRALYARKSPGRPPIHTGVTEANLTMLACSTPPDGRGRWTLQLLADQMVLLGYTEYISDTKVLDILKKTNSNRGRKK
ncbi:MAG: helix-turn-helix domain-containing protein, partial [Chloroflexota bacterium]|nr:helix-turn-helix domain-containing protein [Chloroflexota bacterium]